MKNDIPIIQQLQSIAADSESQLSDLLRKALIVATKLGLKEFREWIESELNGYQADNVPDYRRLRGNLLAHNPYRGLIPFVLPDDLMDMVCNIPAKQPVGEIEHLVRDAERTGRSPRLQLGPSQVRTLCEFQQSQFPLMPVLTVSPTQLAGIIHGVRNRVLDWALRLEALGILGEGLSFSQQEKEKAGATPSLHITAESFHMGDRYEAGQAGAMGPKAHARDMSFQQLWQQHQGSIDLPQLAVELSQLRAELRKQATDAEHDQAIGELGAAEVAAKKGDGAKVMEHLAVAGKWTLETATKIGTAVAAAVIKHSMGLA